MEWLPVVATRQSLLRKGLCFSSSTSRISLNKAHPFLSPRASLPLRRYHAFTPSSPRMADKKRNTEEDLEDEEPRQVHPLSGYYQDILSAKSPYERPAPTARLVPAENEKEQSTPAAPAEPQSPQDKMSIVFGTRLASPGRSSRYDPGTTPGSSWKTINGVIIPPRPEEPDNCCMSGCAHCVWDDYRDDMEDWAGRLAQAKERTEPKTPMADMRQSPRAEVQSASQSMDDDGGGSDTNWPPVDQSEDLFSNIPVGIREFMKTEKKLKKRREKATA